MNYFTADLHLGHKNIIELASRPFLTTDLMDEALIRIWNNKVKGNDTVYIVGDLLFDKTKAEQYIKELKGKKVILIGNHDLGWFNQIDVNKYFVESALMIEKNLCNHMITLSHYPLLEWRGGRKDLDCKKLGYHVHGHIHGRCNEKYRQLYLMPHALNAGVDVNNFEPVTFEELCHNNAIHKKKMLQKLEGDTE